MISTVDDLHGRNFWLINAIHMDFSLHIRFLDKRAMTDQVLYLRIILSVVWHQFSSYYIPWPSFGCLRQALLQSGREWKKCERKLLATWLGRDNTCLFGVVW
ncbi:hypothetical protein KY284_012935 [Solanum tuberosum]|nr:hypothetical protein KY284_012935 [Solanum tuberosum]